MNELNLCEILKGHEGETFYSRCFGLIKLLDSSILLFNVIWTNKNIQYYLNGKYCESGEQDLFPSKDQRDWNKWVEEQKPKVPKTWSELVAQGKNKWLN